MENSPCSNTMQFLCAGHDEQFVSQTAHHAAIAQCCEHPGTQRKSHPHLLVRVGKCQQCQNEKNLRVVRFNRFYLAPCKMSGKAAKTN